jgi:hypothetical protein
MALSELLPTIHKLSASEKLKLIRILTEDLESDKESSMLESSMLESMTVSNPTQPEWQEKARERLLRYAGAIGETNQAGIDNDGIDADLAKAYANDF